MASNSLWDNPDMAQKQSSNISSVLVKLKVPLTNSIESVFVRLEVSLISTGCLIMLWQNLDSCNYSAFSFSWHSSIFCQFHLFLKTKWTREKKKRFKNQYGVRLNIIRHPVFWFPSPITWFIKGGSSRITTAEIPMAWAVLRIHGVFWIIFWLVNLKFYQLWSRCLLLLLVFLKSRTGLNNAS